MGGTVSLGNTCVTGIGSMGSTVSADRTCVMELAWMALSAAHYGIGMSHHQVADHHHYMHFVLRQGQGRDQGRGQVAEGGTRGGAKWGPHQVGCTGPHDFYQRPWRRRIYARYS